MFQTYYLEMRCSVEALNNTGEVDLIRILCTYYSDGSGFEDIIVNSSLIIG